LLQRTTSPAFWFGTGFLPASFVHVKSLVSVKVSCVAGVRLAGNDFTQVLERSKKEFLRGLPRGAILNSFFDDSLVVTVVLVVVVVLDFADDVVMFLGARRDEQTFIQPCPDSIHVDRLASNFRDNSNDNSVLCLLETCTLH
jgi:hypothetical protein